MKRINVWYFYTLGSVVRPLTLLRVETSHLDRAVAAAMANMPLSKIGVSAPIPLKLCVPEAQQLRAALSELIRKGENNPLVSADLITIRNLAEQFETTLAAELREMDTYHVSPIGIYSTTALLNSAVAMFGDDAPLLPSETAAEFNEAGKCLAFSLYTAAGFHLLRAVESAVRIYYDVLSKGAARPTRGSMGIYLDELLKLPGVDTDLESVLRQIKKLHRDPVAHPEVVLNQTEATSLIGIVHSAISRIIELTRPKKP